MERSAQLRLPDGRQLGYAEFGDPSGFPVLYFHGSPSSRLEPLLIGNDVWQRLGLRVVAPDRPGMGQSDFQPGRRLVDWPVDVASLADALELARFAVLGFSGGGPYVTVCAALLPQRLTAGVIVSGGGRMDSREAAAGLPLPNRLFMLFAKRAPWLLPPMLRMMAGQPGDDPARELAQMKRMLPAADYRVMAEGSRVQLLGEATREALAAGMQGAVWDMRLYVRDFGFALEEVAFPLQLFHGTADPCAPLGLARSTAAQLRNAELRVYEGEAHLSTLCNHIDEIAAALRRPSPGC
jgi:pimeloyl-ACP methyl ester carboxylesterase